MAVRSKNAHWKLSEIKARHWESVARLAGIGSATPLLQEIVTEIPHVIETVGRQIRKGFPYELSDRVFKGLAETAAQL